MLGASELLRLGELLESLGIQDSGDALISLLSHQDSEGRQLLFSLLSRFDVCQFGQYQNKAHEVADIVMERLPPSIGNVLLLPLLGDVPARKSKSGDAISWLMSRRLRANVEASGRQFAMASEHIPDALLGRAASTAFVMVDDFIGSGKTARKAVDRLVGLGVPGANIYVCSFVGMVRGETVLREAGVNCIMLSKQARGISDAINIDDKAAALEMMARMEERNGVRDGFRLGYEQSESLALMCFCPNNTFPVFWWDGPVWNGAFSR